MTVEVFALLKEHFDKKFVVSAEITSIDALKTYLVDINPGSALVLKSCRFAVDDEFVENDYLLKENDHICIIPPSSGG